MLLILLLPGLHLYRTVVKHEDRRHTGLKLAEEHAVFQKAVVRAVILRSQLSILEGAMVALKATDEGRDGPLGIVRADQAGRDQRGNASNAIRAGKLWILDARLNVLGPVHCRMLRTERKGKIKAVEVKSDQVTKRRGLNPVERVDRRFAIFQDRFVNQLGRDETNVNSGIPARGIPCSGAQPGMLRNFQSDLKAAGSQQPVCVFRINDGRERSTLHVAIYSGGAAISFVMHFCRFTVAIRQNVMKNGDHFLSAPHSVSKNLGCGLQTCSAPLVRVSQE